MNLIQSAVTELFYDEAYYWYYAQYMAWGYFDHPPMVALLIKMGSFLPKSEFAVRIAGCLLYLGTVILLWRMIDDQRKKENIPLFFLLVFAMPLINVYGFITLPDTCLLFFTTLFLFLYQRFLQGQSLVRALLLGFCMAALMYSKYHGILIIIFVLLSNLRLLGNKWAWLAVLFSLALYLPHLWWLYEHDFVSIVFHLFERPNQPYTFQGFTLGYFLNLIVIFGLAFPWAYWALFKAKGTDVFTRALLFLAYGFILFFFISSFTKRTQAQWLLTICVPMALLAYRFLLQRPKAKKWFFRVGVLSALILLYGRAWLVYQPLIPKIFETHGKKEFVARIQEKVGDIPVVFENSYRRASVYQFYSGNPTFSLNNLHYRHNQFSIDGSEDRVRGKKVAYLSPFYRANDFEVLYKDGTTIFNGSLYDEFISYRKLRGFVDPGQLNDTTTSFELKLYNPYTFDVPTKGLSLHIGYLNRHKQLKVNNKLKIGKEHLPKALPAKDTTAIWVTVENPRFGEFEFIRIGVLENGIFPGLNSSPIPID